MKKVIGLVILLAILFAVLVAMLHVFGVITEQYAERLIKIEAHALFYGAIVWLMLWLLLRMFYTYDKSDAKYVHGVIVVITTIIMIYPVMYWSTGEYIESIVIKKMRTKLENGAGYDFYLVTKTEIFECNDTIYGHIKIGEKYGMHVNGWYAPELQWYRDINKIEKVVTKEENEEITRKNEKKRELKKDDPLIYVSPIF